MFNRTTSTLGALCVFARVILNPIFSSSRQDAKKTFLILLLGVLCAFARVILLPDLLLIALSLSWAKSKGRQDRKENFFDPPPWRPLRLCARPVEYLLDRRYIGFAVKLFHGASHLFPDSLNPNSTESFKYVWLVLIWNINRLVGSVV